MKMIESRVKKRFHEEYILALRERHQYEVRKTNNHLILKINDMFYQKKINLELNGRREKL